MAVFRTGFGTPILTKTPRLTRIYFVQRGTDGPVKIGRANNPERRLKTLQTGCPEQLHLLFHFKAPPGVEGAIHEELAAHSLRGEWFKPHPAVWTLLDRLERGAEWGQSWEFGGYRIEPQ